MPKVKEITSLLQKYLSPYVKQVIFLAVILISYNVLQVLFPQILRTYVEAVSAPSLDVKVLLYSSIIYIGMSVVFRALYILLQKISQELAWATTNNLRIDMTRHCINLDMTFHNQKKTGDMIERIDGDASTLSEFFSTFIHYFIGSFFLVLGILIAVFVEGWVYGMLFLVFIMIALTAFYLVRKIASPLWKKVRESTTALFGSIEESISGLEDIRGNGAEPFIMKRFHEVSQINFKDKNKAMIYSRIYYIINVLMGAMINMGILMISYYFSGYLGTSSGTLYMLLTYGTNVLRPLRLILWQLEQLQNSMANIDRVNEYFSLKSKIKDNGTELFPVEEVTLSFENVYFGYSEDEFVLKGISFSIPHGRTLGLVGRTGSGKTTLARLLFRLYDPNKGAIKINGIDIRNYKLKELRANVSYITQEVELFKASIKDNVTFFNKNYPEEKVEAIVNEVGLSSWLKQLPNGLETEIYSEDCGLSAGEEQLLALSRAFLKSPKIVILDEASSRLDPATEQQIDLALEKLLLGRTGIIIAHRLSTLHKVDDILILSRGEILEYGPREELLKNPNSHFSRLLQKGAEEILI
ncbi:MAG: ABC transporter ATP-binding protein/permease [Candidatus Heimdallarchaeota archaeon]|nr:ABC transporter ATP-binding protein/permease [Candidatus Heimdallarchaeota archaeon]